MEMLRNMTLPCVVGLAAMAGSGASAAPPTPTRTVTHAYSVLLAPRLHGWMASTADASHPWLYVAGFSNNVVAIYDLGRFGFPQIGQITDGVNNPVGVTVDAQGAVYVANQGGGNVAIYPAGATTPSLTLSQGLSQPTCAAVDTNGDVYVTDRGSVQNIVVYPQGQTIPSTIITNVLIQNPVADFFDSNRNLYFSDFVTGMNMIPSGSGQPVSLHMENSIHAQGAVLDPTTNNVFVDTFATIRVYKLGGVEPVRRLNSALSANGMATGAVKGSQYIFVSGWGTNQVGVFRSKDSNPLIVFSTVSQNPTGVGFKPAGVP
jgi:streptogramin lyase